MSECGNLNQCHIHAALMVHHMIVKEMEDKRKRQQNNGNSNGRDNFRGDSNTMRMLRGNGGLYTEEVRQKRRRFLEKYQITFNIPEYNSAR
ncbi:PREDICTED: uncharacterized protein LOC107336622 isoform X3 [Acropora digitifera]|uniref:uncharacterized protein LOC107336622 isoform X3 n=1 Tax=Acropora digitifera TaxID=70779 RepID=UPI00077AEBE3|nr:PREDICTED: uncharacterized protein LOC107336622 isoform X3 [Acropora digitifera]